MEDGLGLGAPCESPKGISKGLPGNYAFAVQEGTTHLMHSCTGDKATEQLTNTSVTILAQREGVEGLRELVLALGSELDAREEDEAVDVEQSFDSVQRRDSR